MKNLWEEPSHGRFRPETAAPKPLIRLHTIAPFCLLRLQQISIDVHLINV